MRVNGFDAHAVTSDIRGSPIGVLSDVRSELSESLASTRLVLDP
jgi:hypothetical protein